jgi:hypothetical protein
MKNRIVAAIGALILAGVCGCAASMPSGRYQSACFIRASKKIVAEPSDSIAPDEVRLGRIKDEMLRYDRVMSALADTQLMKDIQVKAGGDPNVTGRLEEELYRKVVKHTTVKMRGSVLIKVSYYSDSADEAFAVLDRLSVTFIEKAFASERNDARRARDLARTRLERSRKDLETMEAHQTSFRDAHPGIDGSAIKTMSARLVAQKDKMVEVAAALAGERKVLAMCEAEQKALPKDADAGDRAALRKRTVDARVKVGRMTEIARVRKLAVAKLEEEAVALPGLVRGLKRLELDQEAAELRYARDANNFARVESEFNIKMEGIASFHIVSPPRRPTQPSD